MNTKTEKALQEVIRLHLEGQRRPRCKEEWTPLQHAIERESLKAAIEYYDTKVQGACDG